jgi:branched-chain amino acid transport system substrate-binding protein
MNLKLKKSATLLVAALSLAACQKKTSQENTIRIGEFGSMTGTEATFGISTHRGIKMVIDEVNAAGGIAGKKLELITLDNGGKAEETVSAVTRLIAQEKVSVLLGEVASSRSLAGAPIAQRAGVPMISPSSTNPKVTEVGPYIFRVCFTDPFQGTVIAKFSAEELKAKTAALLIDKKSDYSVGLADFFRQAFTAKGGKIVDEQSYQGGDIDFKGQLTNIRAKNPDVIIVPGYYTEVGLIIKQARDLGVKAPFVGGDGWDSPKLFEIGGPALVGSYFSNHYSVDDPDPMVQDFIKRYKAANSNEVPDGLAAMGYDAAMVLVDALKRATNVSDKASIRDAIAATKNFRGVTGVITIDEHRNASKPAVMLKIADAGALKFVKRVEP